jgi:hypothetical protein
MSKGIDLLEYDHAIGLINRNLEKEEFSLELIARINDMLHKDWVKLDKKYPET